MASLDIYRPAAMEQLAVLGRDLDIPTLPIVAGQKPAQIAKRALELQNSAATTWCCSIPPAVPRSMKR